MRRIAIFTIAATTFIFGITAFGQNTNMEEMMKMMQNTDGQGMMDTQPGRMGNGMGMMGGMGMMPMMRMMSMMQGNQGMMSGMMGAKTPSVFSIIRQQNRLKLNQDQIDRLQEQALQVRKQFIQYRADLDQAVLDVQLAVRNADPDRKQLYGLVSQQTEAYGRLQQALLESYFGGLGVLSDEQRKHVQPLTWGCPMMERTMTDMSSQGI